MSWGDLRLEIGRDGQLTACGGGQHAEAAEPLRRRRWYRVTRHVVEVLSRSLSLTVETARPLAGQPAVQEERGGDRLRLPGAADTLVIAATDTVLRQHAYQVRQAQYRKPL